MYKHRLTSPSHFTTGLGVIPPPPLLSGIPLITGDMTNSTAPHTAAITAPPLVTAAPTPPQSLGISSQTLSLPQKLVKKILDLEYVDMNELLPDTWRFQDDEQKCCHQRRGQRRGPITDILLWVECYSTMVSILSTRFADKTPQFMAYQQTIVKAHRAFLGEGWITYDTCYRRKAAVLKSLDWGAVDFTLYNETFTGRAKSIPHCCHCFSEHHSSQECTYAPDTKSEADTPTQTARRPAPICQLYNGRNGSRCNFTPCKFKHLCSECRGNHPAAYCRRSRPPPAKMARMSSPYSSKK